MKKESIQRRISAIILVMLLVFSSLSPVGSAAVYATENANTTDAVKTKATTFASADPTTDLAVPEGQARLLTGDENIADEDALVLTIVGDGFTVDEQDKFFEYAQNTADYIMNTSPWDEFTKNVKIYGIGVASNESGVRGSTATSVAEAEADTLDTYFQSSYWMYGTERIVYIDEYGEEKLNGLMAKYCPESEFQIMLVNCEKPGGAGGSQYCVFSIDPDVYECAVHELGHTVGDLADEYWASTYATGTYANISTESDPEKVSWSRFIGKNGIGVYEHSGNGAGYYRPSQNCKMQYLGEDYELCEVCKEQMRKKISEFSNIATLSFQTYADKFYVNTDGTGTDMRQYFILRQGASTITGDQLSEDEFTLTYTDEHGQTVDGIPDEYGNYTITAEFAGNDTYDSCSLEADYFISYPNFIDLDVDSKTYDGNPIDVDYSISTLEEGTYDVEVSYTGTVDNAYSVSYDSNKAPYLSGDYTVTVTAKDKTTGEILTQKSKDFSIDRKVTAITYNNDYEYPGASPDINNKTFVIVGEGFTAAEQEKFEELAKQFVNRILDTEPFKELQSYFNFSSVETVSEKSGIGTTAGGTYFYASYDENGTIVPDYYGSAAASSTAYYDVEPWYQNAIVIVNDSNVKESVSSYDDRIIYCTPDEAGADYAARAILNYLTYEDSTYVPQSDEEKAAQKADLLEYSIYYEYGLDYSPILCDAYKADFVENGSPVDIKDYIHTYIGRTEVPSDVMDYNIVYYTDDNGSVGTELSKAPSKAGTYHAFVETVANDGYDWGEEYDHYTEPARIVDLTSMDLGERYIAKSRNWTTFTIKPAVVDEEEQKRLEKIEKIKNVKATVTLSTADVKQ
ncbi:MAG: M64 family metallopeptidase, partial [Eubacteriaceae bacterium]|nr:M64 family metallopeptidase [Eubacteriaceae bacterium]